MTASGAPGSGAGQGSSPGGPVPVETALTRDARIELPVICGPMYPCSNPELVSAVSRHGGLGVIQPVSLTFVHGREFRAGVREILDAANAPVGMNALIEGSNRRYRRRMEEWIEVALEEGVRFFITSLGKPGWVARVVQAAGGVVYHDVTERKWALKAVDEGVNGLIAVNRRAGGHAGPLEARELLDQVGDLGLPVVCAGGLSTPDDLSEALGMGYAGVQMGTRFIATEECNASQAYKEAILRAEASDIVLSERVTGVPVALLNTPWVRATGTSAGPLARRLLRWRRTRHWMRTLYALRSLWQLRRSSYGDGAPAREFWQAGESVAGVKRIEPVAAIMHRFRNRLSGPARTTP